MTALASVPRPPGHDRDDLDLVARVRAGDERAFDALYRRYQPRVTAFVRARVRDHGRAEDITQEVFMSALRRLRETDGEIAFKPWIYEIAKNACTDAWRRARNVYEVSFDANDAIGADDHRRLAQPGVTPDSAIDAKLAFADLRGALGGLSETHHDILVMREFEGLSYREIGERLGMSRPGVESTLFRARRRLGEEYEELVSGARCVRVQAIVDAGGGAAGLRDQRRMAKHLAHCQPCRRYARLAGVDLDTTARRAGAASKIAAWLPLPLFLRRRWAGGDSTGAALVPHSSAAAQWSASVASAFEPATVSSLSKAIATAATVAAASVGAGAAIHEQRAIKALLSPHASAAQRRAPAERPGDAAQRSRALLRPGDGRSAANVPGAPGAPLGSGATPAGAGTGAGSAAPAPGGRGPAGDDRPSQRGPAPGGAGRELGATAPVPSSSTTAAGADAVGPQQQALSDVLNHAGDDATAGTAPTAASAPPHAAAPSTPSVDGVVSQVAGNVTAAAPAAPSAPSPASAANETRAPAADGAAGTVTATATDTLKTAARIAP